MDALPLTICTLQMNCWITTQVVLLHVACEFVIFQWRKQKTKKRTHKIQSEKQKKRKQKKIMLKSAFTFQQVHVVSLALFLCYLRSTATQTRGLSFRAFKITFQFKWREFKGMFFCCVSVRRLESSTEKRVMGHDIYSQTRYIYIYNSLEMKWIASTQSYYFLSKYAAQHGQCTIMNENTVQTQPRHEIIYSAS